MLPPVIHVHTQADKVTIPYARFMWETMLSLANHPDRLRVTAHCMGPAAVDRLGSTLTQGQAVLTPPDRKSESHNGSRGHGACVMNALRMTGNDEIHIIADSDTVVVKKGWDDYVRQRLLVDGYGIIGSTYEDLGGFSSGADATQTYKKIPSLTWCALSPMHDWRNLDIMPNKEHSVHISTQELSTIYNLPIGYNVFGEVGWQIPQYLHDNKLKYEGWRHLKPSKDAIILKGLSDYHEEFHNADNEPILVHHRGSLRHSYRVDKISIQFYTACDRHLDEEKKRTSKWSWNDKLELLIPNATGASAETASDNLANEWLKITLNGNAIRPKSSINRGVEQTLADFSAPVNPHDIIHLRFEGNLKRQLRIAVPHTNSVPYMLTCRNVAGAALLVGEPGHEIEVPSNKTYWLLVDVDGVQRVE